MSNINNKKIASRDDLGSDIIVGDENTPSSSLPGATITRTTGVIPSTASVNTLPGLVGSVKDDSSITTGSSGFGSLPKKKNDGMNNAYKVFQINIKMFAMLLLKIRWYFIDGIFQCHRFRHV